MNRWFVFFSSLTLFRLVVVVFFDSFSIGNNHWHTHIYTGIFSYHVIYFFFFFLEKYLKAEHRDHYNEELTSFPLKNHIKWKWPLIGL